jgi:CcmD family protein
MLKMLRMLRFLRRLVIVVGLLGAVGSGRLVTAAVQPPPGSVSEFKPISELPPTEKLPAAPFLVSAYAILWLIALFYIWTIWRRVNTLEGEFRTLERRTTRKDSTR